MIKRAILFCIMGVVSGAFLGTVSEGLFVNNTNEVTRWTALLWGLLGAVHGVVLFACSLGNTPVIEDMEDGRFVTSDVADSFDYRRFGHRIPYIAATFGLVAAFVVAPILAHVAVTEVRSVGIRIGTGFGLAFAWTVVSMLADTVLVSKIALR